ncbi:MAG: LysM peptidoglycan-binding domain-containing protein [Terrimicrobiaceae bacterium]|nr:LysM peptidoglycan-binding domain-containing protein [Terrimicrobiaceae bacterium]
MIGTNVRVACALWAAGAALLAQTPPGAPQGFSRVEPGLEQAVRWKWNVVPSPPEQWGLELPEPPPRLPMGQPIATPPPDRQNTYVVQRGDALAKIARRFEITVAQLKAANNLQSDLIREGQELRIPTPEEIAALRLTESAPARPTAAAPAGMGGADPDVLLFQVYLDRRNFSAGPIDGKPGFLFQRLMYLWGITHPDQQDLEVLRSRARAEVPEVTTRYTLRPEDFRFILPPRAKAVSAAASPTPARKPGKSPPPSVEVPPPTYEELVTSPMLAYRSPWEFVAERFRCDPALLRALNPSLPVLPPAGTEFFVPNVIPFELERAFDSPLRPPEDPSISAVIVDLSRLEIYRNDRLIATFPVASARPSLRGRGEWQILDALPRPRMATRQEPRVTPRPTVSSFYRGEVPEPAPPKTLPEDQFLPPGPNNPVGILWLNLAKAGEPDPLPFGLHGTSDPVRMQDQESLGGFQMANWDIARVVRMVPAGTPLIWKESQTAAPAPAGRPPG